MAIEYERNLRGKELAKQIINLNGHQQPARFIFFHPAWFFMMLTISISGLVSILSKVALAGLVGFLFELSIWSWYFVRTKDYRAYPGLKAWLSIQIRRYLMPLGRSAGTLSKPR